MSAHDVAAVLAEALLEEAWKGCWSPLDETNIVPLVNVTVPAVLAALTSSGITCVYVPEGVTVEHGAKLYSCGEGDGAIGHLHIEATP